MTIFCRSSRSHKSNRNNSIRAILQWWKARISYIVWEALNQSIRQEKKAKKTKTKTKECRELRVITIRLVVWIVHWWSLQIHIYDVFGALVLKSDNPALSSISLTCREKPSLTEVPSRPTTSFWTNSGDLHQTSRSFTLWRMLDQTSSAQSQHQLQHSLSPLNQPTLVRWPTWNYRSYFQRTLDINSKHYPYPTQAADFMRDRCAGVGRPILPCRRNSYHGRLASLLR